ASTASSAEPPAARIDQPAAKARWQPALHASTASSAISQAPPCTINEGFMRSKAWQNRFAESKRTRRSVSSYSQVGGTVLGVPAAISLHLKISPPRNHFRRTNRALLE